MRFRAFWLAAILPFALAGTSCAGATPVGPDTLGHLVFTDSGCSCAPAPRPDVTVYVDGNAFRFPLFGRLDVPLTAGEHRWSLVSNDASGTRVEIAAGGTQDVHLYSNDGCSDGCGSDSV
jgi:hypothetical protein